MRILELTRSQADQGWWISGSDLELIEVLQKCCWIRHNGRSSARRLIDFSRRMTRLMNACLFRFAGCLQRGDRRTIGVWGACYKAGALLPMDVLLSHG